MALLVAKVNIDTIQRGDEEEEAGRESALKRGAPWLKGPCAEAGEPPSEPSGTMKPDRVGLRYKPGSRDRHAGRGGR